MSLPEKIGRYEIVGELGRGAMGVVYKATDPNIGRTVALKTMRLDVHGVDEEEMLRRFKHEAKLAGVMNHPNIVTIYDAGEDQGIFYIAMEYMEGVTLHSVLHEQRAVSAERMLKISSQILPGLDYAHKRGVIHRDVKPANIMISGEDIKIMDFGIAKSAGGMTSAGQVLGTPAYMSPEQVRGKTLDGRSDLFSYGVCLYEMVTGEKPFTGQNVTTIIYKIMNETPVPPRELDVTIHPGISAVITKALEKNPDQRYQSGAELLHELENYKSFGSSADTTQVMAASTGAHAVASAIPPATSVRAKGSDVPTMVMSAGAGAAPAEAKTVAVPSGKAAAASKLKVKSGPIDSVESTVQVAATAAKRGSGLLDNQSKILIAIAVVVLIGLIAVFRPKAPSGNPQPTSTAAPAETQAAVPAQTAPASPAQATPGTESPKEVAKAEDEPEKIAETPAPKKQPKKPVASAVAAPAATTTGAPSGAATPELGSMHISTTPAGAKVSIGSVSQEDWITPFTAHKLAPGDYELTFSKAGFVTQKRHATVIAGKSASMGVDLVEAGAKITVTSTPAGAAILVDGKPSGKVTPATLMVDAGSHQITVRQQGFNDENTSIALKNGETYNFAPILETKRAGGGNPFRGLKRVFGGGSIPEGKGMLQIKSNPEGALIMHNGKAFPKATPLKAPMDPGTYTVTIRLEGYKPMRKEFTIEKGKSTDVEVDLIPK
ncbi:MAG: serine/threonine protein kinase [Acidobacteriales bacterium]|nr:serine/threonine protein kinase [Terriglobales bacterium]